jgi:S-adenosylmethionine decarboxylase
MGQSFTKSKTQKEEPTKYKFVGSHYFASFIGCKHDKIINIENLKATLFSAILASGATILNYLEYEFDNHGYTCVVLLSESHCSIHTYPEHDSFYVDLFTCGTSCDANAFRKHLVDHFEPKEVKENNVVRC